ncbi:DMT family transporter [Nitratireductor mangrovi]|uniref:DMT family transporter n=1 Tax=Nitratireductor mangrovi TaxID=2599600 RepID=A0A5B8L3T0_9HYPH|nr:DMT family transporter [Nitratireductor mangrovi]QDZ02198.1 DMT family transporter [Nitratireductor mangrovi]
MANKNRTSQDARSGDLLADGTVYAQLALGMIIFGSATPVSKIVTDAMPVFVGAALRCALGAAVLAPIAWSQRRKLSTLKRGDWFLVCLLALFGMVGFTVFMLYGMRTVSGVVGSVVMATTPAVTATAAVLFLGDAATWRKIAAIGLAVAGVILLNTGGQSGDGNTGAMILGSLLVLAAVCCEAVYTLLGRRMSREFDPRLIAFLAAALSIPLFLPFALMQWPHFDPGGITPGGWMAAAWYGAGTLALGSLLWYSGIAKTQGSIAAGFMALMPVSALVLSYALLGEDFRIMHLAGFGIVFCGVALMAWEHARMADE